MASTEFEHTAQTQGAGACADMLEVSAMIQSLTVQEINYVNGGIQSPWDNRSPEIIFHGFTSSGGSLIPGFGAWIEVQPAETIGNSQNN